MRELSEYYHVKGIVIHGNKLGRTLGCPTANLSIDHLAHPKFGIYAGYTKRGEKLYKSSISIGVRPTVDGVKPLLEAHLFGCDEDFYGEEITVYLLRYIREEVKFNNLDELKVQIGKDREIVSSMDIF